MKLHKFIVFIFVACLILFAGGFAEQVKTSSNINQTSTAAAENPGVNIPKPKIVFDSNMIDFGKIGPESKPSGELKFTNEGNAVLIISNVSQCCGTVTSVDKKRYEPGEKGAIKVLYNASNVPGKITRQFTVFSNDPVNPESVMTLKTEIVNKVTAEPDKLKLFLDEDNAKCPKITIKSIDNQPFSITGIQSTGNCITAKFDPNKSAKEFVIEPKVNLAKLEQNMKGAIDITINHPEMKTVTSAFDVLSRFVIDPPTLIELNAVPGVPILRKIWIFNNYNQNFEIESATFKNKFITILSEGKVNNGYQYELQIMPPPKQDKSKFSDEFTIKIKNGETLKIDCNFYYKP